MSQAGGPSLGGGENIGGVHFTVGAVGAEQAKAAVDQTAASVQNLGNTAQATGRKVATANATGIAGFTAGLKSSTKAFRDFTGAITGTIARFTAFIGIFGLVTAAVGGLVAGGSKLFEWTVKQGKGLKELDERWKTVREQQDKYSASIEKLQKLESLAKGGLPDTVRNLDVESLAALQKSVTEQNKDERVPFLQRRIDELNKELKHALLGPLDEFERAHRASLETQIKAIEIELRNIKSAERELNAFTKRISDALAREVEKASREFFRGVGNAGVDKFSGDRVLNGFVRIEDQLSIIALQRGGREQ